MAADNLKAGVAFNTHEPFIYRREKVSEDSVAKVAEVVCQTLNQAGLESILIPLQRSMVNFLRRIKELNVSVIVNLCEGFFGNPQWESNVAAVMEVLHIPFTGNGARTLALCQDKHQAKAILSSFNLPVAPSQLITSADEIVELRFPMIIKPNSEDASLGVHPESVVYDRTSLAEQIKRVIETYDQPAMVEEFIEGREFNVAILDDGEPKTLPVSEIDFPPCPRVILTFAVMRLNGIQNICCIKPPVRSALPESSRSWQPDCRLWRSVPSRSWVAATMPGLISE